MARVIDDGGPTADILKPLALPVFEPTALPDPTSRARSLIVINDRHNGELVPRLAISTGAAWLRLSVLSDLGNTQPVDVTPIVEKTTREEIARALPAIVQSTVVPALPAPSEPSRMRELIEMLELMNSTIQHLEQRVAGAEQQIATVADNAVASVRVENVKAA